MTLFNYSKYDKIIHTLSVYAEQKRFFFQNRTETMKNLLSHDILNRQQHSQTNCDTHLSTPPSILNTHYKDAREVHSLVRPGVFKAQRCSDDPK